MSADYLHGSETIEINRSPVPVKAVRSAVIGVVGTAPSGPVNKLTLLLSEPDIAQFGQARSGFTLPQALSTISGYGAGTVLAINVLDPSVHKTSIPSETVTFVNGTARLEHAPVMNVTVKAPTGNTTYTAGTDYQLSPDQATLTRVAGGGIDADARVVVSYDYADPTKVTAADVIGAVDAAGKRTGLKLLADSYSLNGFDAKILIAPVYCTLRSVTAELEVQAEKLQAVAYVDAPVGTTPQQAITGRGSAGIINFNTASGRLRLCYPHVKVYDAQTNADRLEPLSSHTAGLRAWTDLEYGYWWSSSNQLLKGVTGIERPITARIDDPQSESNLLNAQGITTVFNSYGTGYRLWGNRVASYPSSTGLLTFENCRRVKDMTDEAIRFSSLSFIDQPITQALIDTILESVNQYGRKLIGDGALLGFKCWYDKKRNEEADLADGHMLISYKLTPPPPLERLTLESEITSEYLVNLNGNGGSN
ncbi:phage tail sheath subtilisin-like domain-containing protein [Salmonella enterica]|uniref:Phage tail sheath family protein n=1 Tax=Salmonella enterica TaxID=28901 RepID=A0A633DD04_SALER|nr:phage tail sheath family protein [Salmonella enterica]EBW2603700.1 phage tail sheath family protein [Salmonella enterica subsp. enterica serovar Poano]EBE9328002.1 phage tail sheath family protein [Salmonella enterica]ECC0573650.1 phage tail sheath family protein [Salmonella enterica]ECS5201128.1 phage tail sheath family protein [Salmonella enterica subsp. enterica serovar Poano]